MTIIELARYKLITRASTPYDYFIRSYQVGKYFVDSGLLAIVPGLEEILPIIKIIGVSDRDNNTYERSSSLSGIFGLETSFYFDISTQVLYVHLPHYYDATARGILQGNGQGFTDSTVIYIDGVSYLPMLESFPAVRQQQDIQNYNKLSFITGTVAIGNNSGRLDDLIDEPIYGNEVLQYYLQDNGSDYVTADLQQVSSLFVEDYDFELDKIALRIQDKRKSQNIKIPSDRFSSSSYVNIEDDLIDKVIPVLWGQPRGIPATVVNGKSTSGNVHYRAALLLTNFGTAQVFKNNGWSNATILNGDLSIGYFELSQSDARDSSGEPYETRLVRPTGIAITRLTDIIKDANNRYLGASYTSNNYDTTEWAAEETSIHTGAYFLEDEIFIFDLIKDIQNGANVGFRYEIKPDGRRTIRVDNESRAISRYVSNVQIFNRNKLPVSTNIKTLVAESLINYDYDYSDQKYLSYFENTDSDTVFATYRQRPRTEIETLLTLAASAEARGVYINNQFSTVRGIVKLLLAGAVWLDLRIYDMITVEITSADFVDIDNDIITGRTFFGVWDCKILSIAPDTQKLSNEITAVLVRRTT